jgi:FkbM family methyltransferase
MADALGEPRETELELKLHGGAVARLIGDPGDTSIVGSIASNAGQYDPSLMAVLSTLVKRDSVCLDVGANVGPITLALSALCPDGHVHSFEPAIQSFRFLERNAARNGVDNVSVHRLALSDTTGEAKLNYNREFTGGAFISDYLRDGAEEVVPTTTLDDWAESSGLDRLDLVKIDVEGAEGRVLTGGRATIERFRPTLVLELNPICLRRMQRTAPREFFRRLHSYYGALGHLALVSESGKMLPLYSWGQLRRLLAEFMLCNLVCSPRRLLPGAHPGVAGPRAAAAAITKSAWRYNRFSTPPWAADVDPRVTIRTGRGAPVQGRALYGSAASRFVLPLLIENRSGIAIVGAAERFPVSVRVIWIDGAGHHRIDDRSRVPAPTVRPGSVRPVDLPVFLPDEPGSYTIRIALFQESLAWFHDLDPASCRDLEVIVA